jgi:hypothetical protein
MCDAIYRNALRAARELWFDEQNLGERIPHPETISPLRQAKQVSMGYNGSRSRLRPELPAGGEAE